MRLPMRTPLSTFTGPGRLQRVREWKVDQSLLAGLGWQEDAFLYYRVVGQIRKVENNKANTAAACRLRIKKLEGEEPVELDPNNPQDQAAQRVFTALRGPTGGKRELIRTYMLLADIAGEAFLVGTPTVGAIDQLAMEARGESPGLVWEFLSRQEIRGDRTSIPGRTKMVRDSTGSLSINARQIPPDAYIARWHQSDPQYSEQPDSPMRSVIPDAEEYVQLRDVVAGAIKARMSAGILIVPKDAAFGSFDETLDAEGEEMDDDLDPLMQDLLDHMGAPITDRRDPAVYVPMIVMSEDAEALKAIRWEPLSKDNNTEWATPLREEKLRMIAQSLDAPPEKMTGSAEVNHWGNYSIKQDFASEWIIPRGEDLAMWLTEEYQRPMLQEYEQMDAITAERYVIEFDSANITAKADKGVTAIRLYQAGELSADSMLRANGFDPDEKPDDIERGRRFIVDMVLREPGLLPAFSKFLGLDAIGIDLDELAKLVKASSAGAAINSNQLPGEQPGGGKPGQPPPGGGDNGLGPVEGDDPQNNGGPSPAGTGPDADMQRGMSVFDRLVRDLTVSADMAAERGLERAAARIVTLSNKRGSDPTVADLLRGRPREQVFMLCSDDHLSRLGVTSEQLLDGAWESFGARATLWVSRWLAEEQHRSQREVSYRTREIVEDLCAACQNVVLDSGGDRRFGGMLIPEEALRSVLEVGGLHD